jgi:hypothetical protein
MGQTFNAAPCHRQARFFACYTSCKMSAWNNIIKLLLLLLRVFSLKLRVRDDRNTAVGNLETQNIVFGAKCKG